MIELANQMRDDFDFILIDSPAGIEQGFKNAVAPADRVLIITTPEVAAVRDADRIIGLIEAEEKGPGDLIVNRLRLDMVKRGDMLATDDVIDILAINLIGVVPEDETIITSTNTGRPVVMENHSHAGQAFRNIAQRLIGEEVPFMDFDQSGSLKKWVSKIFR
jgi:septum site-determining protein MinD